MATTESKAMKAKAANGCGFGENGVSPGYEADLWRMADALRGGMDAAEYKHVVLGLVFLKYISDVLEELHAKLEAERSQGADPEDPDEYRGADSPVFWVPLKAKWAHVKRQARQPTIGRMVDDAMEGGIERDNPVQKGVLPKEYARPALDKQRLGQLIELMEAVSAGARGGVERSTGLIADSHVPSRGRGKGTKKSMDGVALVLLY